MTEVNSLQIDDQRLREELGTAPLPEVISSYANVAARVLVVDDTEMVRRLLTAAIMTAGHEVTAVTSCMSAVDAISANEPFDLLVLDYELGDGMGTDVYLAAVRRTPGLANRAIFVSGNPSAHLPIRAVAPHAPVLIKPV